MVGDLSQLGEDPIAVLIEQVEPGQFVSVAWRHRSAYARTVRIGIPVERSRVIIVIQPRSLSV